MNQLSSYAAFLHHLDHLDLLRAKLLGKLEAFEKQLKTARRILAGVEASDGRIFRGKRNSSDRRTPQVLQRSRVEADPSGRRDADN